MMVLSAKAKRQARVISLPVNNPPARQKKRKLRLTGPGLVLVLALSLAVYSFASQLAESFYVNEEIEKINLEMMELKERNAELKKQVSRLQSDAWVERTAREKLGLVKPGERLILQVKPGEVTAISEKDRKNIEVH